MNMISGFIGIGTVAALGTIIADYRGRWRVVYILKPTAMAAIISAALLKPAFQSPRYRYCILAGLALSLAGDIFLMLRNKRFVEGLTAFLFAHLFYIAAFLNVTTVRADFGTVLPLFLYALIMMTVLFPTLGRMKIPVAVYIFVVTIMAGVAIQRFVDIGGTSALRAFLGALLFVVSDSALAINRFVKKFSAAQAVILSTYFAAQWLLALSV
jgi:uncharacterized membrane protein YhhN